VKSLMSRKNRKRKMIYQAIEIEEIEDWEFIYEMITFVEKYKTE
jgi:hypothetical protein